MHLFEEYFKRHAIKVPLVKHVALGYLFFREPSAIGVNWQIFSSNWSESIIHPGTYTTRFIKPVHNSREFEELGTAKRFRWDEYEEYIYALAATVNKNNMVSTAKAVTLTAWEMFVFSNDHYFAQNCNSNLLFETLDYTSSIDRRYSSYLKFIRAIDSRDLPVFNDSAEQWSHGPKISSWKTDLSGYTKNYSYWLVDLIHGS